MIIVSTSLRFSHAYYLYNSDEEDKDYKTTETLNLEEASVVVGPPAIHLCKKMNSYHENSFTVFHTQEHFDLIE